MTAMTTREDQKPRELAIKIVEEIRCPDYGMHRETEAFKEFFAFLVKEISSFASEAVKAERQRCVELTYKNITEMGHFAGDYHAGGVQAAKNIAHEILNPSPSEGK